MPSYQLTAPPARSRRSLRPLVVLPVVLGLVLLAARTIASYVIEYRWWQEMNQVPTWLDLMLYGFAPLAAATLLAFGVLFGATFALFPLKDGRGRFETNRNEPHSRKATLI